VNLSTQKWLVCGAAVAALQLAGCAHWTAQEDLPAAEIARQQAAGAVLPFNKLNAAVIALHPGSEVSHAALDKIDGRFLYQVIEVDPNKLDWVVEVDARTGQTVTDKENPE
jgi:uncharacterized membrane protein YkoI